METVSTFAELIVDYSKTEAQLAASLLKGRVHLDPAAGSIHVVADPTTVKEKVLLILLGQKALKFHGMEMGAAAPQYADRLTPRDVERMSGLLGGTIRPVLRTLASDRLIAQDGTGYFVPAASLSRVAAALGVVQ